MSKTESVMLALACTLFLTAGPALAQSPAPVSMQHIRDQAAQMTPAAAAFLSRTIQFQTVEAFGNTLRPETKALLQFVFSEARKLGFTARLAADGMVGVLDYGSGPETVGVLVHLDVVPASTAPGSTWTHPPFAGTVADGYVWGRGSQDDKGALIATLYGAKILIDAKMPFKRRLRVILGTKEEKSFEDLTRYFAEEPQPDFGIVPDGVYFIEGEKGIADIQTVFSGLHPALSGRDTIVQWAGGTVINTVPDFSYVVIASKDPTATQAELAAAIQTTTTELAVGKSMRIAGVNAPYESHVRQMTYANFVRIYALKNVPPGDLVLLSDGLAMHGSAPWAGRNAMAEVAFVADRLPSLQDSAYRRAFAFVTTKIGLNTAAGDLGVPFTPPSGLRPPPPGLTPLQYYGTSSNLGLVAQDSAADTLTLAIDFRTGLGNNNTQLLDRLQATVSAFGGQSAYVPGVGSHYEAIYHPGESPLMKLAVGVYRHVYPDRPAEMPYHFFSPGTTYLKLVQNFVNFGPVDLYPDPAIDRFHEDDERMSVASITQNIILFAQMLQTLILAEPSATRHR